MVLWVSQIKKTDFRFYPLINVKKIQKMSFCLLKSSLPTKRRIIIIELHKILLETYIF